MNEEQVKEQIVELMQRIKETPYGGEEMDKLQRQLHSYVDILNKLPKKRKIRDWFWENSRTLLGIGAMCLLTAATLGAESVGPIFGKAFGFIPKPKIF